MAVVTLDEFRNLFNRANEQGKQALISQGTILPGALDLARNNFEFIRDTGINKLTTPGLQRGGQLSLGNLANALDRTGWTQGFKPIKQSQFDVSDFTDAGQQIFAEALFNVDPSLAAANFTGGSGAGGGGGGLDLYGWADKRLRDLLSDPNRLSQDIAALRYTLPGFAQANLFKDKGRIKLESRLLGQLEDLRKRAEATAIGAQTGLQNLPGQATPEEVRQSDYFDLLTQLADRQTDLARQDVVSRLSGLGTAGSTAAGGLLGQLATDRSLTETSNVVQASQLMEQLRQQALAADQARLQSSQQVLDQLFGFEQVPAERLGEIGLGFENIETKYQDILGNIGTKLEGLRVTQAENALDREVERERIKAQLEAARIQADAAKKASGGGILGGLLGGVTSLIGGFAK